MLLVGGDSFSEFPKGHWHVNAGFETPCPDWDGKSLHWCELLANEMNLASKSVGIGAGDSATTSYETIRQLYINKNITHCIFFITNPWRTVIREKSSKNEREYKKRMIHYDNRLKLNLTQYYQNPLLDLINMPGSHYTTIDKNSEMLIDEEHLWCRLDRMPEYEFVQKQLNGLTTISTMAKKRGIKMLFATGFSAPLAGLWVQEELEETLFVPNLAMSQSELRSHYNAQEHKSIFEKFKFEVDNY
jgi:hypothetical protein